MTFGLGNRCSILLSYGTKHAVYIPTLHPATIANAQRGRVCGGRLRWVPTDRVIAAWTTASSLSSALALHRLAGTAWSPGLRANRVSGALGRYRCKEPSEIAAAHHTLSN